MCFHAFCSPAALLDRFLPNTDVIIRLQIRRQVLRPFKSCDLLDATITFKSHIVFKLCSRNKWPKVCRFLGFYYKIYSLKIKFWKNSASKPLFQWLSKFSMYHYLYKMFKTLKKKGLVRVLESWESRDPGNIDSHLLSLHLRKWCPGRVWLSHGHTASSLKKPH